MMMMILSCCHSRNVPKFIVHIFSETVISNRPSRAIMYMKVASMGGLAVGGVVKG